MKSYVWFGTAAGAIVVLLVAGYFWLFAADSRSTGLAPSFVSGNAPAAPTGPTGGGQPGTPASVVSFENTPFAMGGLPANTATIGLQRSDAPFAGLTGPTGGGVSGLQGGARVSPIAVGKPGAPTLEDIQKRLLATTANGRQPNAREVDAVLADLQKNQGSNNVAGVDLQKLRTALVNTERIQQLALEMQAIAANPRKDDLPRLQVLATEMQRLQASLVENLPQAPVR